MRQRAGTRRNDGTRHAKRRCPEEVRQIHRRTGESGATEQVAASEVLTLRHGMETRCPAGAGQRQRSWLCA
ncbi:Uncharacterised protein [Edwardsiella hoshinae]|uniref:Uncharacterized protein n=1 Tax=Edwardsiella hoshinae TaxID=93378 RepID=A0A376J1V4_9GAMM|nr:hypothetical protein [Edwardsiella hoshinae]STE53294.1 Uncharacterised protein [Edwardsiella hoshinae]